MEPTPLDTSPTQLHPCFTLSSLPAELIQHVSLYLDVPTFRALRLTASRYHHQTAHTFKKNFFITRHLQWTEFSLQRLVTISEHPDLGKACQHLVIDATPHHALLLWKMRRRSADAGHMTPITDDEDGSKLIKKLNEDYDVLQQKAEEVARWFNETRFDVKCLTTAFSRLQSLQSVTFAYQGMGAEYSKFRRRYCEVSQLEMSRPVISTLAALAASGAKIGHVGIHEESKHGAISIGRLESLAPSLRCFDAAFENLETLQLNLRDWRSPDTGFEIEQIRAPFVVRFLAKCRNVRVLELSCYSALEEDLFGALARTCRFNKLQRCRLESFRITHASDLMEFLAPCSDTLEDLQLQHILNTDPETTWAAIFTSLADSPSCLAKLRSFVVARLFSQQNFDCIKRVVFHDRTHPTHSLVVDGDDWRANLKARGCRYIEPEGAPTSPSQFPLSSQNPVLARFEISCRAMWPLCRLTISLGGYAAAAHSTAPTDPCLENGKTATNGAQLATYVARMQLQGTGYKQRVQKELSMLDCSNCVGFAPGGATSDWSGSSQASPSGLLFTSRDDRLGLRSKQREEGGNPQLRHSYALAVPPPSHFFSSPVGVFSDKSRARIRPRKAHVRVLTLCMDDAKLVEGFLVDAKVGFAVSTQTAWQKAPVRRGFVSEDQGAMWTSANEVWNGPGGRSIQGKMELFGKAWLCSFFGDDDSGFTGDGKVEATVIKTSDEPTLDSSSARSIQFSLPFFE
ncbi:hypothetical protein OPT61_g2987 [Boeremia exigua]|uniref:Uncharacterized protein n=1 Tax=Boeremia exigua TaxID=749465 RepID=A0ACC2IJF7_9PLEO|nr:hypothetical protein OPT61_g2987 [Boeremia exigua]